MIEPMTRPETADYIPVSSALLWMTTNAGSTSLSDTAAWEAAVNRLRPLISTEQIEIIGRQAGSGPSRPIKGHIFADVLVSGPLKDPAWSSGGNPWILSFPYNPEMWERGFNDQLFLYSSTPAAWTHLQLKKSDVLREFQDATTIGKLENNQKQSIDGAIFNKPEYYSMVQVSGRRHEWVFRAMAEIWPNHRVPRKSIAEIEKKIAPAFKRISGQDGGPGSDNIRRILDLK
jgi:hypothetical protein